MNRTEDRRGIAVRGVVELAGNAGTRKRAGFSLVEVMIGLAVLVIAIMGALSSITSSAMLGETTPETTRAHLAAMAMLERMRAEPFDDLFARYNTTPKDDPTPEAPGADFEIAGLDPQDDDADGMAGEVLFPAAEGSQVLREDLVDPSFGMPRDLNADGTIDAADHADDYAQLPVRVRVSWRGATGEHTLVVEAVLGNW